MSADLVLIKPPNFRKEDFLMKEHFTFAVQMNTKGERDLLLSPEEKKELIDELEPDLSVLWLPPSGEDEMKIGKPHGLALESAVLIFTGMAFASIVKPFVESIAKEAGKDFWNFAKHLVSKIWKKQSDRAYTLKSRANLIFELDNNYVAIEFKSPMMNKGQASVESCEVKFEKTLQGLGSYLDEIRAKVQEQTSVATSLKGTNIYWVRITGTGVNVVRVSSWDYIGG